MQPNERSDSQFAVVMPAEFSSVLSPDRTETRPWLSFPATVQYVIGKATRYSCSPHRLTYTPLFQGLLATSQLALEGPACFTQVFLGFPAPKATAEMVRKLKLLLNASDAAVPI
jgi:hypothetical protein